MESSAVEALQAQYDSVILNLQDQLNLLNVARESLSLSTSSASSTGSLIAGSFVKKTDDKYFDSYASKYIDFTYANPTIYHVVKTFGAQLTAAGFSYVSEKDSWLTLKPGKYFTTRNGSNLVAFVVGDKWTPEKGVGVVGSHIDALTVVLKPNSTKEKVEGYELLGVAPYAGGLSDVWWDRDLGIGGRILVKNSKTGKISDKLVDSTPHPIAHIPTLAPHFGTPSQGPFNKETQAVPVVGFSPSGESEAPATPEEKKSPLYGRHPLKLLRYIAKLAGVSVGDIVQWDLQLYDVQKGIRGGLGDEFVFAPRVDDRVCSYAAISALIDAVTDDALTPDSFSVVGLFDNEEIGSGTRTGVKGGLTELAISRVLASDFFNPSIKSGVSSSYDDALKVLYANTIILSADVNHLLNPNFASVYLEHHKPVPNNGITIALDPNGHMATDSVGLALVEELARINGDLLQYFQIRNDSRSGGTIGPYISVQTGARTIDLGIPQLSMHSIRATLGAKDIGNGIKFFEGFFANWQPTYSQYGDL